MTVAENIWIGREELFSTGGLINSKKRETSNKEIIFRIKY
jgi:ABC-type sugar transport system ATPase subunit